MHNAVFVSSTVLAEDTDSPECELGLTDEELTALALAADPDQPVDDTAVPLSPYGTAPAAPLPMWYMPPAMARAAPRGWRTPVIIAIIGAFLLVDLLGLCITYGQLVFA